MDKIIVQDNFLTTEELNICKNIIDNNKWTWNHTSNGKYTDNPFWSMELSDNEYFTITIKNIIEKNFSKKFRVKRVYANGHTYGQDGSYHIDNVLPNHYTFCVYLTDIHNKNIDTVGGYLFFKFPDLNYKICYEPKYNRSIFFPSNYIHKATSFSRFVVDMRICVSWKLEEII